MSVYVAHAGNSFYYFGMVVTCAIFGLLAVAVFPESSIMSIVDWIKGKIVYYEAWWFAF